MTEKELGLDRYIEITPDGQPEQFRLDEVIERQGCLVGRATTCWRACRDEDKSFAVKDYHTGVLWMPDAVVQPY
jgi:protein kinase-like protein